MSPEIVSERQLVRKAAIDPSARLHLKNELFPHVVQATKRFIKKWNIPDSQENELTEVAMNPFDEVLNIYLKNLQDRNNEEGHFYKYYNWWVRKAISEHLHSIQESASN